MRVVEKFVSINGEGQRAGELAVFIRFQGCNLNCSYCDTRWANEKDCPFVEMTPEEIYEYVKQTGVSNVTVTGGEPLLQKGIDELFALLAKDKEIHVEVETNGAVAIEPFVNVNRPSFTLDYKSPSSGCESYMVMENYQYLNGNDTVKFVVGDQTDLNKAKKIIEKYDLLSRCRVYFSPVFGSIEPAEIVDFMIENKLNKARIQIQMHKVIWDPNERGV